MRSLTKNNSYEYLITKFKALQFLRQKFSKKQPFRNYLFQRMYMYLKLTLRYEWFLIPWELFYFIWSPRKDITFNHQWNWKGKGNWKGRKKVYMDIFLVEKLQDIFLHSEQKKKSSSKVKDHYISLVPKYIHFVITW